jgi:hypothetical protein
MDATLDPTVSARLALGKEVSHRPTKTTTVPSSRTAARRLKLRAMFDVLERLDLSTTPLSDRGRTALQTLVKLCFPDRVAVSGDEVILTVNASLGLIARAASWSRVTEKDVNVIAAMAAAMLAAQGVAVDDELRTRQRRREADEALTWRRRCSTPTATSSTWSSPSARPRPSTSPNASSTPVGRSPPERRRPPGP